MKLDTHVHLLPSKSASPDWDEIRFTLDAARRDGLDAVCICEHLDATHYHALLADLFERNVLGGAPLSEGVLRLPNGLTVSAGAEVSLRGGGDAGVHASPSTLRALDPQKGVYSLPALLDALEAAGEPYAIVAHHVYFNHKWIDELPSAGRRLDAIELPAKDLGASDRYRSLASQLELPLVGGGDGHTWLQVGACYTFFPDDAWSSGADFSVQRFKDALKARHAEPVPIPGADRFIRMSRLYRDRINRATPQ
ncbi:PHP-associated domain-containing protein [Burkholderia oklahomensis]|uniref:PHP-associated domain-containing protein n=1 Tax=Burkholderia oklahomensis TaxID=342113 RepID=UPI00016A9ECE|nr:PHP-associated domain-containing protein [Burkholderia oklahomensis]AJX35245.1 PHP-associated family protein [Burkholderia oklahomensis C6786]AOI48817.1 hypothetical protein WI23_23630 [Burkholderia oklahomensis C6786]KUY50580.1 hypothetical protein WI23_27615 [Burkholderia oklahomensis C6786]MBI0362988.1 hypothetical protein [Burkholderia oklahomensis]SUY27089.1 Uncharacterised protein [Burkholderia oklahomensis]